MGWQRRPPRRLRCDAGGREREAPETRREHPDGRGQQNVGALDAVAQIAFVGFGDGRPRVANLARQPVHGHIAEACRVDPDFAVVPHQVIDLVSILSRAPEAFAIQADPNLANRAEIATEIDPRTGISALVFDGGAGHYQAVAGPVPANLEYHRLTGPLASGGASLVLLTLDVRLNRPNYPTFVDLDFDSGEGVRASTAWNFRCWTEIQNPNIGPHFILVGGRSRDAIVISGRATKVPFGGVSDIPGPVTLLGLVPTDEGRGGRTMDPAYVIQKSESGKPTTVFVPF